MNKKKTIIVSASLLLVISIIIVLVLSNKNDNSTIVNDDQLAVVTPADKPSESTTNTPTLVLTVSPEVSVTPTEASAKAETPSPEPTKAKTPTPETTKTETVTPKPTKSETATQEPTKTEAPTLKHTATPAPTNISKPINTPIPTNTFKPTKAAAATKAPSPTQAGNSSDVVKAKSIAQKWIDKIKASNQEDALVSDFVTGIVSEKGMGVSIFRDHLCQYIGGDVVGLSTMVDVGESTTKVLDYYYYDNETNEKIYVWNDCVEPIYFFKSRKIYEVWAGMFIIRQYVLGSTYCHTTDAVSNYGLLVKNVYDCYGATRTLELWLDLLGIGGYTERVNSDGHMTLWVTIDGYDLELDAMHRVIYNRAVTIYEKNI